MDYENLNDHEKLLEKSVNLILDCKTVLASKIGPKAMQILSLKGIHAYNIDIPVEDALRRLASSKLVLPSNQNRVGKLFKASVD